VRGVSTCRRGRNIEWRRVVALESSPCDNVWKTMREAAVKKMAAAEGKRLLYIV
jgi:hypothetical protein